MFKLDPKVKQNFMGINIKISVEVASLVVTYLPS